MSIIAQSPPHLSEITKLFIHNAATLLRRSLRYGYALYAALTTTSLRQTASASELSRHILCASATLTLRSWRSDQLQAWFKGTPKVGVAL